MKSPCLACGANLNDDQERCDLCGTRAGVDPRDLDASDLIAQVAKPVVSAGAIETNPGSRQRAEPSGPFCNACGWENPSGAKFCSKCGQALQATATQPPVATKSQLGREVAEAADNPDGGQAKVEGGGVGKQVGIIVGSALMVVVALYLIGVVRQGGGAQIPVSLEGGQIASAPLAPGIAQQVEALDDSVAQSAGDERLGFMRQKVDLFLQAGRYDLAGSSQSEVSRETGLEVDWVFAGNLYYDQMERSGTQEQRTRFAKLAIAAYREVLANNPDNLDVRTDMAVAYLSDPDNPMSAIQETQEVLRRDSLHVQANFNRGIMLSRINRVPDAIAQFEKVQRIIGDPEAEIYGRAQAAIETLSGSGG